jgi:outer membrane protein assembly factor BamB
MPSLVVRPIAPAAAAVAVLVLAAGPSCSHADPDVTDAGPPPSPPHGLAFPQYHFDGARTGWSDAESVLVPARVRGGLSVAWSTPLDAASVPRPTDDGLAATLFAPRVFAAPLYMDDEVMRVGPLAGISTSVLFVATTNDWLYAIAAVDTAGPSGVVPAGTVLWRLSLGTPAFVRGLDFGAPLGVLSTPVIDTAAHPPTLYVTALDAKAGWRLFAVDLERGTPLDGWPLVLDPAAISALDENVMPGGAPPAMAPASTASQRAGLALSRGILYVGFGSYYDGAIGWMVAVDTATARVIASFSGDRVVPTPPPDDPGNLASAGIWGAGGPAVASDGRIFVTTGNSPEDSLATPGVWGNSLLVWDAPLSLAGTYSPFNYCLMDAGDTDLAGSTPVVFDVDPTLTGTPHLAVFGGKQGVLYIVDRDALPGSLDARPGCSREATMNDPSSDGSLLPPGPLAQYVPPSRGPLSVFGPYSDAPDANQLDNAKMRTTPALFRPSSGDVYIYASGTSRDPANLPTSVPPGLVRIRVDLAPGQPAFLEPDFAGNGTSVLKNPGSPIVSSHGGGQDPVVWVLDQNAVRTDPIQPLGTFRSPDAVLYAFDGSTLETLWESAPGDLGPSGKYGHVVVAHGTVLVATDRVTAFAPP